MSNVNQNETWEERFDKLFGKYELVQYCDNGTFKANKKVKQFIKEELNRAINENRANN